MSDLEWYHNKGDIKQTPVSKKEQRIHDEDWEDIKNQWDHRDKEKKGWRRGAKMYNVLQEGTPNSDISNIYVGWVRSYIDTSIAQINEGEPEFDFDPFGQSDSKRVMLWKAMVKTIMNKCGYRTQQNIAFTDSHVMGPGVLEVFQQSPYRTLRVPDGKGGFDERVVPDFRRPRVGVRAISPMRCSRNPNVSDPNEIGSCTKKERLTWNQFVQNYGRVYIVDEEGKKRNKYKNVDQIPKGSHVDIVHYQDEVRDVYRIYAVSYGNKSDGEADTPPENTLGRCIFDKPLKKHDVRIGSVLDRSEGLNIPGLCNLVWFPFNDKYDGNYETHSVYGLGLPEQMKGLDDIMQTFFNMTVDNWRLANTVLINYKGNTGSTMPDFDANVYYGGEYIDGEAQPFSLGMNKTLDFDQMYEVIQKFGIPGTGININQITGDTSKTAFEFAQRVQANSQRQEKRIKGWEEGPLKRLGTLLLSAGLSELTVDQVEQITEQQAESVLANIKSGVETRDDYVFENGKPIERRVPFFVQVKGLKEDFSQSKSRKLDFNAVDNTLVKDLDNPEAEHKVPIKEEYVYPSTYIESGVFFDTTVDSSRLIANRKIRDIQAITSLVNLFTNLVQIDPTLAEKVSVDKLFGEMMKFAEIEEERIMQSDNESDHDLQSAIDRMHDVISSPPGNVQTPQESPIPAVGPIDTPQFDANAGGSVGTPTPFEKTASGGI